MKTAVIYWSGTGNTEAMANAVAEGMKEAGAEVTMLTPDQVQAGELGGYGADKVIVCESPLLATYTTDGYAKVICDVIEDLKPEAFLIGATNIGRDLGPRCAARLHTGLCADCGWGDGQWMRDWESDCSNAGISLTCESVTCCETPDDTALAACREMGKALAG